MGDSGMQCVLTIAKYHGIAVNEMQLRHTLVLENVKIGNQDILKIAKKIKLKSTCKKVSSEALLNLPLPAILKYKNGEYVLLLRCEESKCLILETEERIPKLLEMAELEVVWDGTIFLFVPRLYNNQQLKFGIRWFLPSIMKFKKPLLEVLFAALIMQLLAVVSPLITQSVIDKVLTHNSLSTLLRIVYLR